MMLIVRKNHHKHMYSTYQDIIDYGRQSKICPPLFYILESYRELSVILGLMSDIDHVLLVASK